MGEPPYELLPLPIERVKIVMEGETVQIGGAADIVRMIESEAAFIIAIATASDPRPEILVFADWLEESGDIADHQRSIAMREAVKNETWQYLHDTAKLIASMPASQG